MTQEGFAVLFSLDPNQSHLRNYYLSKLKQQSKPKPDHIEVLVGKSIGLSCCIKLLLHWVIVLH
jgi:hypothetical protein